MDFIFLVVSVFFMFFGVFKFVQLILSKQYLEGMLIDVEDYNGVYKYEVVSHYDDRLYGKRVDGTDTKIRRILYQDVIRKESLLKFYERKYK